MKIPAVILSVACACTASHVIDVAIDPLDPAQCSDYSTLFLTAETPTAFPVEVLIDTDTTNHNIGLILTAIDIWNTRLGQEVLYATITANPADMHDACNYATVTTNTLLPNSWVGLTTYGPCAANHVDIETMDLHRYDNRAAFFSDSLVTQIATHELGHVLGLPHEADRQSIMYPTLSIGDVLRISSQSACLVWLAVNSS